MVSLYAEKLGWKHTLKLLMYFENETLYSIFSFIIKNAHITKIVIFWLYLHLALALEQLSLL
jgi:hypothetical protein